MDHLLHTQEVPGLNLGQSSPIVRLFGLFITSIQTTDYIIPYPSRFIGHVILLLFFYIKCVRVKVNEVKLVRYGRQKK